MIFNIVKANKEISTLTLQVESLIAERNQLKEFHDAYKEKEEAFTTGIQAWATEKENLVNGHAQAMADLETNYKNKIDELTNSLSMADKKSALQAADLVASLGVEPETIKTTVKDLVITDKVKRKSYLPVK